MTERDYLAQQFEENRGHLRGVAYRMLGSLSEADDAIQEAWLRLNRSDADSIGNLGGWLTTVVARVCLDMLRSRGSRLEESLDAQSRNRSPPTIEHQIPSRKPFSRTRLALRCSWCSTVSHPPNASRSCFTICSRSHSTRSQVSSDARPTPPVNSPAAPVGAFREQEPLPTETSLSNVPSSTVSSRPCERATSKAS